MLAFLANLSGTARRKAISAHHYIRGRPNSRFGADYIGEMNLSQKCVDLRCNEFRAGKQQDGQRALQMLSCAGEITYRSTSQMTICFKP